jgi:hypothetical protein
MNLLRPISITDDILVASDVPEDDYAVYSAATTYADGDKVLVASNHKIYESIADANTGNDPVTDTALDVPLWWLDLGYDNRWKMFDGLVSTSTVKQTSMEINLQVPFYVDSIALLNISAEKVTVKVALLDVTEPFYTATEGQFKTVDGEDFYVQIPPIYFNVIPLDLVQSVNSFEVGTQKRDIVLTGLTDLYNGEESNLAILITLETSVAGADVECGMCVLGIAESLGVMEWAPTVGIIDYSQKTTDVFGNPTILERKYSKRMAAQLWVENGDVDALVRRLAQYRATPVVWSGSDQFDSTIIYGWYRNFDVVIESPAGSRCSLEIEGLI